MVWPSSNIMTRNDVVMKIIKARCKIAEQRADRQQKSDFVVNYRGHRKPVDNDKDIEICSLFPPRNKWCHIGRARIAMDSMQRNALRLKYTYLKAARHGSTEQWYVNLCKYADDILRIFYHDEPSLPAPKVGVIKKKDDDKKMMVTCRPVCTFEFKVKIMLSLLNRFLTNVFDPYFHNCSYAFRMPMEGLLKMQHQNAVVALQNFRKSHKGQNLYVAECDMQKFYDTIDHDIIKRRLAILLHYAVRDGRMSLEDSKLARKWMWAYIDCFDFRHHVLVHNKKKADHPFWNGIERKDGYSIKIEWIDKENYLGKPCLGVPQGGPLSGLIANVVMHFVDNDVITAMDDSDMIYLRFCDDMILVGADELNTKRVLEIYAASIGKSLLFAHPNKGENYSRMSEFWNGKTRGPYIWGEKGKTVFPWVTFVGFDMNWEGCLRIRKGSFKKQMDKQNKIVNDVLREYSQKAKSPRYCKQSIMLSLKSRLMCMSVGRVTIWNYRAHNNKHSWMQAFSILDENPWSSAQMSLLDRHRQVVLSRASKYLNGIECPAIRKYDEDEFDASQRFVYTGCPFSYFGQAFKYRNN